jgi:hypothetical protein
MARNYDFSRIAAPSASESFKSALAERIPRYYAVNLIKIPASWQGGAANDAKNRPFGTRYADVKGDRDEIWNEAGE